MALFDATKAMSLNLIACPLVLGMGSFVALFYSPGRDATKAIAQVGLPPA